MQFLLTALVVVVVIVLLLLVDLSVQADQFKLEFLMCLGQRVQLLFRVLKLLLKFCVLLLQVESG